MPKVHDKIEVKHSKRVKQVPAKLKDCIVGDAIEKLVGEEGSSADHRQISNTVSVDQLESVMDKSEDILDVDAPESDESDDNDEDSVSSDSEAEELERLIIKEKEKILEVKKRRLAKLQKVFRVNTSEEKEEDNSYAKDVKSQTKRLKSSVEVAKLKVKSKGTCRKAQAQNGDLKSGMDINLARSQANIEDLKAQLAKFKVGDLLEHDTQDDDDSSSDSSNDEDENKTNSRVSSSRHRATGKTKLISGLFRGSSNKVKKEVMWPMDKLGPQHTNYGKQVYHKDLDMRLLVLGELAIIKDNETGESETNARMEFLTDLIFNAEHFEWSALLRLHAAVLREIETGNLKWGESYSHMTQLILTPFPKRKTPTNDRFKGDRGKALGKLWYCKDYNTTSCSLPDKHAIMLSNGNSVEARHICAKCYFDAKEQLSHSSKSDDCPRK